MAQTEIKKAPSFGVVLLSEVKNMIMNMSGGGATMNFRIVGGTTAPANPQENTIWINTANKVTSWALAFDEPSNPVEGMVWVVIGASGHTTINALKKNVLSVAPMAAKQYVGGAWVNMEGQIYINKEWRDFVLYMIKNGKTIYPMNVVGKGMSATYSGAWESASAIPGDGYITVKGNSYGYGIAYVEDIDLTHLHTLTIDGTFNSTSGSVRLIVWDEIGNYIIDNMVRSETLPNGEGTLSLDVSGLAGIHTVGISSAAFDEQNIKNFWAE